MSVALLRDIASAPRATGTAAIAAARERCAGELRSLGFVTSEQPFDFSEFPGRFATPLFGGSAALLVGVAGHLGAAGERLSPLLVVGLGAITLLSAGLWLARRGVLHAPVLRQRGVNLQATRAGDAPGVWLCAHLDTKSQPVPTLVRTTGVLLTGNGFILTVALAVVAAAGGTVHELFWATAAIVTLIGAIPVVLSVVGSRSPGALDNASGVATVIAAARDLAGQTGVGVLITDAEELGLAGARAWAAAARVDGAIVLNCDGVDDAGATLVMFSGARPERVLVAVERASEMTGVAARARRLALGILTDSVAFTDAGMEGVTFSRASIRSLARIHSRRDDLTRLTGTGIADTARLIAATARELTMNGVRPTARPQPGVTN